MGVFYELGRGSVRLRPGLQSGLTIITGSTRIGTSSVQDVDPRFLLGPALSAVVHVGRLELGIATEAFFLPSQPAAPSAGVYATTGWVF